MHFWKIIPHLISCFLLETKNFLIMMECHFDAWKGVWKMDAVYTLFLPWPMAYHLGLNCLSMHTSLCGSKTRSSLLICRHHTFHLPFSQTFCHFQQWIGHFWKTLKVFSKFKWVWGLEENQQMLNPALESSEVKHSLCPSVGHFLGSVKDSFRDLPRRF